MKTNLISNLEVSSLERRWKCKDHIFVLIEEMKIRQHPLFIWRGRNNRGAIIVAVKLENLHQLHQDLEFLLREEKATNSHLEKKQKRPLGPKPLQ
jgi:hypothetical protein